MAAGAGGRARVARELAAGVRGAGAVPTLWRGLAPTLWRDIPFSMAYWPLLEGAKRAIARAQREPDAPGATAARAFGAGAGAGAVAALATTPFDVIKTRRQVQLYTAAGDACAAGARLLRGAAAGRGGGATSTWATLREVVASEGPSGLFVGATARVLKVAPACAIMIASYEGGKRYFDRAGVA